MDPGESLFCEGANNIQIKTVDHQNEELEDQEEHHRKNKELGHTVVAAFDDIDEYGDGGDCDDSINDSRESVNDESPHVSQSDHYTHKDAPDLRVSSGKYAYQNASNNYSKARNLMFQLDHSFGANGNGGSHPNHQNIPNGWCPTEDDQENSSYHYPVYHFHAGIMNGDNYSPTVDEQYRQADLGSQEQLMILYRARVIEVQRLEGELQSLRHDKDSEIEALKRQLLLMETEKQGAMISQKEAQNLLDASKTQVNSLQHQLDELQASNMNLEKDNSDLLTEVNLLKASATDLQQKVTLLERNGNTIVPSEKQMEAFYKALQQRHQVQLRDLQSEIETVMDKLRKKEGECVDLEQKLGKLSRAYDALQIAKADAVNSLATKLDETQQKLQDLASKSAVHELTKLQIMLEQTQNDKKALEEQLALASKKLESVEADLLQYESASRMGLFNSDDSYNETDSITHLGISRQHSSGGKSDKHVDNSRDSCRSKSKRSSTDQEDLSSKLQTELHRALQGQHSKRAEIRRLQEQLAAKEKKMKSMLEKEQIYLTESKKYEANLAGVLVRLKRQEEDLKTSQCNESRLNARCEELERDLQEAKKLAQRVQILEKENAALKEQIVLAEREGKERNLDMENYNEALKLAKEEIPSSIEKELIDLKVRLEQSQKDCDETKQFYVQICAEKRELMTRFEEKDARLSNEVQNLRTELNKYEARYRESQEIINKLKAEQDALRKSLNEAMRCASEKNFTEIEKVIEESETKCSQLQGRINLLESENRRKNDLEAECSRLREELAVATNRHQKELERVSQELSCSRERIIQLESKLREEFRAQVNSMTAEIDSLQKQIDQKDQLLEEYAQALSRIKPSTKDAAVETANDGGAREKATALAAQLDKAEERHRNVVEILRQEFDRRIAAQEKEMKAAHERQLVLIAARYKAEVAAIEDQLKEDAAKYFAEEFTAWQEKHVLEHNAVIKRMRESEALLANHIETLKGSLQERIKEVEELNKKMGSGNCDDCKQLQQQIDSERDKMAEMLSCWAGEVQDLRNQVTTLSDELSSQRAKYKEMKKLAIHYKKLVVQVRQDQKDDFQRKEQGYREALYQVKERVKEVVDNHEKERRNLDEMLYENQLLGIAAKQRREMKFTTLS